MKNLIQQRLDELRKELFIGLVSTEAINFAKELTQPDPDKRWKNRCLRLLDLADIAASVFIESIDE